MRTWLDTAVALSEMVLNYRRSMEELETHKAYVARMKQRAEERAAVLAKESLRKRLHAYKRRQRAKRKAEKR